MSDLLANATFSVEGGPQMPVTKENIQREMARLLSRPSMKEGPEDREVKDKVFTAAGDELRSFCERYEQLEVEKREIADQMNEVMAEAKGRGYDTKILRKLIALRKRDPDDVAEEQAVLDMYKDALGMAR